MKIKTAMLDMKTWHFLLQFVALIAVTATLLLHYAPGFMVRVEKGIAREQEARRNSACEKYGDAMNRYAQRKGLNAPC